MSCTLEERVALLLLELSENFGVREKRGWRLTIPVRQRKIAQMVGASRPRVTVLLLRFERTDLIARDRRDLIVHRGRLEYSARAVS